MNPRQYLKEAIDEVGGRENMAAKLGVTENLISVWVSRGKVSAKVATKVAEITSIQACDLRPDLFTYKEPELYEAEIFGNKFHAEKDYEGNYAPKLVGMKKSDLVDLATNLINGMDERRIIRLKDCILG